MAKQTAVEGPIFMEMQQNRTFPEFFVGRWERYGGEIDVNPSNDHLICDYCRKDFERRRTNQETSIQLERSYQVKGYTDFRDKWSWDKLVCKNPLWCWGRSSTRQITRVFDVRRKDSPNKPHVKLYRFAMNNITSGGAVTVLDEFYCDIEQVTRRNCFGFFYTGMASKTGRRPNFFNPNLFDHEPDGATYYINVDIVSRHMIPEEIKALPIKERPSRYQEREFVYPTVIDWDVFRASPDMPPPRNSMEMRRHIPVARVSMNCYPGGCGMIVYCYKYCRVADQRRQFQYDPEIERKMRYRVALGEHPLPHWIGNGDEFNNAGKTFIPNFKDGYGGPLTSTWSRMDDQNRFFS